MRRRVTLEFTPEAFERLQSLQRKVDASSNAEVVRRALKVYEWLWTELRSNERQLVMLDPETGEGERIKVIF